MHDLSAELDSKYWSFELQLKELMVALCPCSEVTSKLF